MVKTQLLTEPRHKTGNWLLYVKICVIILPQETYDYFERLPLHMQIVFKWEKKLMKENVMYISFFYDMEKFKLRIVKSKHIQT